MRIIKGIISIALLAALGVGFFFAYTKNREDVLQDPVPGTTQEDANQVKGDEKLSVEEEAIRRLPLTPANIVWYTNQHRAKNKLPPLIQRKALNESSKAKNTNMLLYQYFEHTQPGGSIGFDRFIDDQDYEFIKIGENLAMGDFSTSKEVVDAWIRSPEHNRNLLDATYTEIGVNVQEGSFKGKKVVMITQHFGKPRKSCPTVSESTKAAISNLTKAVQQTQEEIKAREAAQDPESISEYNRLVTVYNATANQLTELIRTYNGQVKAFDACVNGN